ncbi:MAG: valine--tRNA ligase [Spirulinaceae cyanobacterium]
MTANIPSLPKKYDPTAAEAKWQQYWEEDRVFEADPQHKDQPYSIVIPPPNVTGSLHMGHAFEAALIDTLVRYHRMLGQNTLCLPGTDHASIAVHAVIERRLREEGKTRYDLGREEFLKLAWQCKQESGDNIANQLKRLGLSADWSRQRFTLDEGISKTVRKAFFQLYEEGLIYRGKYMVNWCPASQSAVSDIEVENKQVDGHLWHLRYPLKDSESYVEVATTRPETMLGDTGIAVNPEDERYQDLIGQTVILPIVGREIPIFADELVDKEFGTGCVKVTPAHDPNDFEMGKRHQLEFINILNKDGSLNENAGHFVGQDRFEARKNVVKQLEEEGFLVRVEDYHHAVPYSDRGKVPIEPLLSTQWFVKIRPLADKALASLDNEGAPHFIPERWAKVYRDWLVKLKDWCISRQLWWGHQIPAWYAVSETAGEITDETPFVVADNEEEAKEKAVAKFGEEVQIQQDPDVLDTWFSSGLWPFSTLGWPEETADFQAYFPNSIMVTGFDIIFFWVARMTMMSGHFTGKIPFGDIYIHGLVRDENGKKMSKSAGNGIDPLLLIDKYGTDALRYTLIKEVAGAGQDIRLEYDREKSESASVEASRNFANKLWNASRFVMLNLEGENPEALGMPKIEALELSDRWILTRFDKVVKQTREYLDDYGLGEAAKGVYEFIWGDFCDWYIELVKPRLREDTAPISRRVAQQTLAYVLEGILKLLHPFMPHITEEIWHTLTQKEGDTLALQAYPEVGAIDLADIATLSLAPYQVGVTSTSEKNVSPSQPLGSDFKQISNEVMNFLAEFPTTSAKIFGNYQKPLVWLGLAAVTIIALQAIGGALNNINKIPLVLPTFELIGVGYTIWFAIRYLLKSQTRQEVKKISGNLVEQILGNVDFKASPQLKKKEVKATSSLAANSSEVANIEDSPSSKINLEEAFELIFGVVGIIRNLRAEADIKPNQKTPVILQSDSLTEESILTAGQDYIQDLGKVELLTITQETNQEVQKAIVGVVGTVQVLIPLTDIVDVEVLQAKLEKNLSKLDKEIKSLTSRLNNPGFINQAPPDVVQGARDNLAEAKKQSEILHKRLERLQ